MPLYSGSQKLKALHVGAQKMKEAWVWSGSAWQKVFSAVAPFVNSGMTKSGTQVVGSSFEVVTPWVVRSGFTGTVIEDNGIRVPSGVAVNITARVVFSSTPGPSNATYSRLTIDGVEIPNSQVYNTGYSDASILTLPFTGTGGIVRVEAYGNGSSARRNVAASSYIEISRA
ncbi:hypothetical protein [Rhodococcoides fascians]|uniref:hypothetical protein n=1 Tax=Rhodococcoides fascians TaxID=1828 RepID=UPI0005230A33|nr:hypothetical protein [Rhodococcus fascians]